jgi:glutaredoxin 3
MNIKVYSTPTCPYCRRAKEFLKENNVSFEDIDVSLSQEAAQEMVEKSGQMGVPVILVDDNIVIGFNKEKLSKFLNIK